ncbi:hypothetical protein PSHT_12005, partial [Puccinia striiformis]
MFGSAGVFEAALVDLLSPPTFESPIFGEVDQYLAGSEASFQVSASTGSVGELVQGGGGAFFILVRAIGQVGPLTGMNLTGISISPALIGINPTSSHWYQSHQLSP